MSVNSNKTLKFHLLKKNLQSNINSSDISKK